MKSTNDEPTTTNNELLSFQSIEKSFFGVKVLKQVSFSVRAGSVIGMVGENGAGKSTLMNILGGNLQPDSGTMKFHGRDYVPKSPREARHAGIGFVHQELNLFPNLSIAENLFLTELPTAGPMIRRAALQRRAAELLGRVGLALTPDTLVERLSAGERQLVEIARALSFNARLIILDEPTTSLSAREAEQLFALIRQLREGRSIIYVSHALGDVLRLCDEIVVLRDGAVVGAGGASEYDLGRVVTQMVGRELKQLFPTRSVIRETTSSAATETLLEVQGLTQPGIVRDISFTVRRGDVLGISGLIGAGRSELARILFGLDSHEHGTIRVLGQPLRGSPRRRIERGLALLTESRRDDGLCLEASVAENLALVTLSSHARTPARLIDFDGLRGAIGRMRDAVRLQPHLSDNQPVRTLSGGNQQKVVFGKWLLGSPRVLILDEPTRGIDVGARSEIYQLILNRADAGCGVLVISSEIEELIGICDRILVMNRGRIAADFARAQFDRERILHAALPDEVSA